MQTFTLPLVTETTTPQEAFERMQQEGVSAVVARVGDRYYLLEAGRAVRAWRASGDSWNIAADGIGLQEVPAGDRKEFRVGLFQLESVAGKYVTLYSKHETWAERLTTGPLACYCENCHSSGRPPGPCSMCGSTDIRCADL